MLGLARRAGKLSMGHDMALKSLKSKNARLLVFASDISPRLVAEFNDACARYNKNLESVTISETINSIHSALGYKAGVITVDDENFSKRILELINQEENVYGN